MPLDDTIDVQWVMEETLAADQSLTRPRIDLR